jgi:hypothetical protein
MAALSFSDNFGQFLCAISGERTMSVVCDLLAFVFGFLANFPSSTACSVWVSSCANNRCPALVSGAYSPGARTISLPNV